MKKVIFNDKLRNRVSTFHYMGSNQSYGQGHGAVINHLTCCRVLLSLPSADTDQQPLMFGHNSQDSLRILKCLAALGQKSSLDRIYLGTNHQHVNLYVPWHGKFTDQKPFVGIKPVRVHLWQTPFLLPIFVNDLICQSVLCKVKWSQPCGAKCPGGEVAHISSVLIEAGPVTCLGFKAGVSYPVMHSKSMKWLHVSKWTILTKFLHIPLMSGSESYPSYY